MVRVRETALLKIPLTRLNQPDVNNLRLSHLVVKLVTSVVTGRRCKQLPHYLAILISSASRKVTDIFHKHVNSCSEPDVWVRGNLLLWKSFKFRQQRGVFKTLNHTRLQYERLKILFSALNVSDGHMEIYSYTQSGRVQQLGERQPQPAARLAPFLN